MPLRRPMVEFTNVEGTFNKRRGGAWTPKWNEPPMIYVFVLTNPI